jgi:hypothetical protein
MGWWKAGWEVAGLMCCARAAYRAWRVVPHLLGGGYELHGTSARMGVVIQRRWQPGYRPDRRTGE